MYLCVIDKIFVLPLFHCGLIMELTPYASVVLEAITWATSNVSVLTVYFS